MSESLDILEWTLDYRTFKDTVPLCVNITNWTRFRSEGWSAELSIRYDRCPAVVAELAVCPADGGYIGIVNGKNVSEPLEAFFETLCGAMLAVETHALKVAHLIPVTSEELAP